jgi:uncharacterized membrane protein YgcG
MAIYTPGFLRIDIETASGDPVGGGPLATVESLTRTQEIDRVGGITFTVPATDPRTQYLQPGRHYKVYHKTLGYLGEFIHRSSSVVPGEHPAMQVQADDQLRELMAVSCLFNREYSYQYLGSIVSDLLTLVTGWGDGDIEDVGYTSVDFQGESVLNAIVELAEAGGAHFRLGSSSQTLDFGEFGDESGIRCMGVEVVSPEIDDDTIAIITELEVLEEGSAIVNRLIPLGSGAGETQLTLEWSSLLGLPPRPGEYDIDTGTNPDGSSYYYIEDTTSQTEYGLFTAVWVRNDIRALSNSDGDLENAADALYEVAKAALNRMKDPITTYRLSVSKLTGDLRPGQTVRVFYNGVATHGGSAYRYVAINEDMMVLSIRDQLSNDGKVTHQLEVSSSGHRPTNDGNVVSRMHRDLQVIKAHVQPSISYNKVGPYERDIADGTDVEVDVRIGDEVLLLNHAILRFATKPLRSRSMTVQSGGGSTESSESGGGGTPTSASGGGGTSGSSGNHSHVMFTYISDAPPAGTARQYQCLSGLGGFIYLEIESDLAQSLFTSGMSADHSHSIPAHTHDVTIPAHTHDVTIPAHTHDVEYGIFDDTHYPQNISLAINGTDVTSVLGGPWALTDAAVEVEVDIAEYLRDASGGLRQTHTLTFSVTGGTDNQGSIDVQVDMLVTIQAIAVT